MLKKILLIATVSAIGISGYSQFHTLKLPQASNYVRETQRLGVTDITVEYSSPRANERDVWSDTNVIPQKGDPIPWRAGANMNTTIEFSTDVKIQGQVLKEGKYGFHVIPDGNSFQLLFAHESNLWGSYYLDKEKDVTLKVDVSGESCPFSEKMEFEFIPTSEDTMVIGLEWTEKRIPFEVSVDLNETVVASLREELRGINTYHWQAWNDAAQWCLDRDTNLEEAYTWANRSIAGGYGGFAAAKNLSNLTTKARIARKLGKEDEYKETIEEALMADFDEGMANQFAMYLIGEQEFDKSLAFTNKATEKYPDTWYISLNNSVSKYMVGKRKDAVKQAKGIEAPEWFRERLQKIIGDMEEGTFELRG